MSGWPIRHFRLSPMGGRGVSCDADGAFVGPVPLLKRTTDLSRREAWVPRSTTALNADLSFCYGLPVDVSPRADSFIVIARALNDGAILHAKIATLHLQFPDLPPLTPSHEEEAALAKALYQSGILKVDWDPAKHPRLGGPPNAGWFAPVGNVDNDKIPNVANELDATATTPRDICHERCYKLLERLKPYRYSDLNDYAYRRCVSECLEEFS